MSLERAVKWEPVSGVSAPCIDISFHWERSGNLRVEMFFSESEVQNIELTFRGVISLRWEEEHFGLNPLPESLPTIGVGAHQAWTFPILRIENSVWLRAHEDRNPIASQSRVHFALVGLNDLLQLLALASVEVVRSAGAKNA